MYRVLIQNASLLLALSTLYSLTNRLATRSRILPGILFGAVVVAGMQVPFRYAPGIIYDGRSIVLAMAGLFGGWRIGSIAAVIASAFRIHLGGPGVYAGLASIIGPTLIGIVFRQVCEPKPHEFGPLRLLSLGICTHIVMLACQLLLPWPTGLDVIRQLWIPIMLVFPLTTMLMGLLLANEEHRTFSERKLRESEERFRLAFETCPDAININRLCDGAYVDVNEGFSAITGFAHDEVIGKTSLEVDVWGDPEARKQLVAQLSATGVVNNMEASFRTKNGELLTALMSARLIQLNGEEHILSTTRDIQAIKDTELALIRANNRLNSAQEIANMGFVDWDLTNNSIEVSPQIERLYGIENPNMPITLETLAAHDHPDDRDAVLRCLEATIRGENNCSTDHRIIRSDGEILWVHTEASVERDEQGKPIRLLQTVADITPRVLIEEELREMTKELELRVAARTRALEASNEAMEAFVYSVSHDLRAPLRAISGFAGIIAHRHRQSLNDEGQHYFDNIVEAASRMENLITDLLAYSRLGREAIPPQPVPLSEIVNQILQEVEPKRLESGAEIVVAPNLPEVMGNPTLVWQILSNIVDNALKYRKTTDGGHHVEIVAKSEGEWVEIQVADNGIGISPEHFDKIFNIFQRLHGRTNYSGTGIGLAVVKKAAQQLGGSVGVASRQGEGSRFWVKLPAVPHPVEA